MRTSAEFVLKMSRTRTGGTEVVVAFRDDHTPRTRFALSRINYPVDDTPRNRQLMVEMFRSRMERWHNSGSR